jgi:hypothetical protein
MAGSSQQFVYGLGVTQVPIVATVATRIIPPAGTNSSVVKYLSGGTLAVVNGGASGSLGMSAALGYILSTTETVNVSGPASFFLSAGGSTSVAQIMFGFSSGGLSAFP